MNIKKQCCIFHTEKYPERNFLLCSLNKCYLPFLFVANVCRGSSCLLGKAQYPDAIFGSGFWDTTGTTAMGLQVQTVLISGVFLGLVDFIYMQYICIYMHRIKQQTFL